MSEIIKSMGGFPVENNGFQVKMVSPRSNSAKNFLTTALMYNNIYVYYVERLWLNFLSDKKNMRNASNCL